MEHSQFNTSLSDILQALLDKALHAASTKKSVLLRMKVGPIIIISGINENYAVSQAQVYGVQMAGNCSNYHIFLASSYL